MKSDYWFVGLDFFESSIGLSTGPSISISTSLATNPFILPVRTRALYHPTSSPTPSFSSPRPCLSSRPPLLQFIFQFAPRSSQVCARRKFAETAGTPLEATWRRDKRETIKLSPSFLSRTPLPCPLTLLFFHLSPLHLFTPVFLCLLCIQPARLHWSSGRLDLGSGPQPPHIHTHTHTHTCFPLNLSCCCSPSTLRLLLPPWREDSEAIQSQTVHQ